MICNNCGFNYDASLDLITVVERCGNCGANKAEPVLDKQWRKFKTDLVFNGCKFASEGHMFTVEKIGKCNTKINYKGGSIQELPTKYILENTEVVIEN